MQSKMYEVRTNRARKDKRLQLGYQDRNRIGFSIINGACAIAEYDLHFNKIVPGCDIRGDPISK